MRITVRELPANHEPQADEPEAVTNMINGRAFRRAARGAVGAKGSGGGTAGHTAVSPNGLTDRSASCCKHCRRPGWRTTRLSSSPATTAITTARKMEHKTALYEEAIGVPIHYRRPWPGRGGNGRPPLGVQRHGFFPTLCDYAGIPVPGGLTGLSLRGLASGVKAEAWREHVSIESLLGYGVRTNSFLYAIYDEGRNREQLYDLVCDPGQTRNFAGDPSCAAPLRQLRKVAAAHLREVGHRVSARRSEVQETG